MTYRFTINGRLAGMNEFIDQQRRNRYAGAKLKKNEQSYVSVFIDKYIRNLKIKRPVYITYTWYEKDKRRDLDNISGFGHKVIQDALVQCGVLVNDGWNEICGYSDNFEVDKLYPRIEVELKEVE